MSKSKKHKKPNIPPAALARLRLDAVLTVTNDDTTTTARQIHDLMRELGDAPCLGFIRQMRPNCITGGTRAS